jgi:hypothetical protein
MFLMNHYRTLAKFDFETVGNGVVAPNESQEEEGHEEDATDSGVRTDTMN